jgi:hypothetical protein
VTFVSAQPVAQLHGYVPCTNTQEVKAGKGGVVPVPKRKPAAFASAAPAVTPASAPAAPAEPKLISR